MYDLLLLRKRTIANTGFACIASGRLNYNGGANSITYTQQYTNDTIASGKSLSVNRYSLASAGNSELGLFAGGNNHSPAGAYATVDKYFFASKTLSAGGSMPSVRLEGAGASNSSQAVFRNGRSETGAYLRSTHKYLYASAVWAAGVASTSDRRFTAAVGNSTLAIYDSGFYGTLITDKYLHATDSQQTGTSLAADKTAYSRSAAGHANSGYFAGGTYGSTSVRWVDRYDYATDVRTPTTSIPTDLSGGCAYGHTATGYFSMGNDIKKLDYSSESWTVTAGFGPYINGGGAVSSTPGWQV